MRENSPVNRGFNEFVGIAHIVHVPEIPVLVPFCCPFLNIAPIIRGFQGHVRYLDKHLGKLGSGDHLDKVKEKLFTALVPQQGHGYR